MMTKLREMTFVVLWILVFAFLGLMVFEWGADITGIGGRSNVIGKVEGQKITIEEFDRAMEQAREIESANTGKSPDYERIVKLRDEVWESFIQRILLTKEINKFNIQVSDREVALFILKNPLPELQNNPQFQTDGRFDMQKYREAVLNPQNAQAWLGVEQYIRETLPFQKLQNLITTSTFVTAQEVQYEFKRRNLEARIEYIYIPVSAYSSKPVDVSEKEFKQYYEKNRDDFKVEEKRKLNYVLFSTEPTKEDSSRIYEIAQEVIDQAKKGTDFSLLADQYSEDPTVQNNHGDLGYFDKSSMVPEFAEVAFNSPPGQVTGPVKTRFGLHIIKVFDIKTEDGVKKVKASHVLLKFSASGKTIDLASTLASDFAESAKDEDFKVVADRSNYEVKQTTFFAKGNYIPGLGAMGSAVNWTFKNDINDVSEVYRTPQGYAILQVAEIDPAGYRSLEDVRDICRNRVELQKRMDMAKEYAEKLQPQMEDKVDFKQIISSDTSTVALYDTTTNFKFDAPIPRVGRSPNIMAAAFELPLQQASNLLETQRGYYFIRVLQRMEYNKEAYLSQRETIKSQLLNQRKQRTFSEWYNKLKEDAKIVDNRDLFYRG
jgi:parvulin-like peptidyl-prolyl isomerase